MVNICAPKSWIWLLALGAPIHPAIQPVARIVDPIRTTPFREQGAEPLPFRVVDLVTGRPVEGVSVCSDTAGVDVRSRNPTDANGRGTAVLPEEFVPPCDVYLAIPPGLGGGVVKAVFPKPPATDIVIPLYARLVVQTPLPSLPSDEADRVQVGNLWCVSWPAPQDAFKQELSKKDLSAVEGPSMTPLIQSYQQTADGAVYYHQSIKRIAGYDASRLICLRQEVKAGSEHAFDIAFAGDVLISYYLPGFDWNVKTRVNAVPGETRRIVLDQLEGRRLRLMIRDDQGAAVAGARVVVVTRWDLGPDVPGPDGAFFVFTPRGSDRRIAVCRRFMESDASGEVTVWMFNKGLGEIYASATKSGHVGCGTDLWSGVGVPDQRTFKMELKRAPREWALFTLDGHPLANCNTIKVTDLKPTSLLGQIDYPTLSTDDAGRSPFEQLVPGHRYAVIAETGSGRFEQEFTWAPGLVIALR